MVPTLTKINPQYINVYGDTNSSMAAALVAKKIGSKIIHIEAGVRDFDYAVPEEELRIKIDQMSSYLFAPSEFCRTVLSYEDIHGEVYMTGNLIVDVCKQLSKIAHEMHLEIDIPNGYLLLTLHRPENVDNPVNLRLLCKHFENVEYKIVFPVHPRTRQNLLKNDIQLPANVLPIGPLGYMDFLQLLKNCRLVLSDSGGIQEEVVVLKKPCITLRHTSARWETILLNANILYPPDRQDSLQEIVEKMISAKIDKNPYGEDVANKIVDILKDMVSNS